MDAVKPLNEDRRLAALMGYDLLDSEPETPFEDVVDLLLTCLLYTSPSPRDLSTSRMPSSA